MQFFGPKHQVLQKNNKIILKVKLGIVKHKFQDFVCISNGQVLH